jgi:hypothetical protein
MRQEREPVPLLRSILASTTSSVNMVDMIEMMLEIGTNELQEDESQQIEMY